ncbi:DUF1538 domain-containing protein [Anaerocolumna chitinilytica]|uniref:Membrane protein n=1 Tax=Anaerocolumna chitinilytica TaxID=1727145 RepID=A0A7I8DM43_9FIRM|nr:DUF1538 domain-containing protein [Anaerocolumna chitinilytica]BCJ99449.1 membrane protein [Anaerocolumna chitinilytica]
MNNIASKIKESIYSVLPITILVLLLHLTIVKLPKATLSSFLIGSLLLILGMGLFTQGADMSMMIMGEKMGSFLTKSRKIWLLVIVSFLFGVIVTVAEPDLQVLARQTPGVPDKVLIWAVALGVGSFLVIAFLRTILQLKMKHILAVLYGIVFIIAIFTPNNFVSVAFDSGGVTTGPITVPFIMALGIGMAAVRGDKTSQEDSFGLISLCSVGPVMAVLVLGIFYKPSGSYERIILPEDSSFLIVLQAFLRHAPGYMHQVFVAIVPILAFFLVFQIFAIKIPVRQLIKIGIGLIYTFVGLVIFLTGVNVGFMPAGYYIGEHVAASAYSSLIIPLSMIFGYLTVAAEPAVHVLVNQVEEVSEGNISGKTMRISLSIGVALSAGLSMIRVLHGLSIWYFILPGYLIAVIMTFIVPPIFTSIAFDSGGVAAGTMTATFLLPLAIGACESVGGNVLEDAFGIIALVAMTPLITIECLGLLYNRKAARKQPEIPEELIIDIPSEPSGEISMEDEFVFFELEDEDYPENGLSASMAYEENPLPEFINSDELSSEGTEQGDSKYLEGLS